MVTVRLKIWRLGSYKMPPCCSCCGGGESGTPKKFKIRKNKVRMTFPLCAQCAAMEAILKDPSRWGYVAGPIAAIVVSALPVIVIGAWLAEHFGPGVGLIVALVWLGLVAVEVFIRVTSRRRRALKAAGVWGQVAADEQTRLQALWPPVAVIKVKRHAVRRARVEMRFANDAFFAAFVAVNPKRKKNFELFTPPQPPASAQPERAGQESAGRSGERDPVFLVGYWAIRAQVAQAADQQPRQH